jgi:hypothetical protein
MKLSFFLTAHTIAFHFRFGLPITHLMLRLARLLSMKPDS